MKKLLFLTFFCLICILAIDVNVYAQSKFNCNVLVLPCVSGSGNEIYCVNVGGDPDLDCACGSYVSNCSEQ